jgi:rhodanese-related sulfurtransferase
LIFSRLLSATPWSVLIAMTPAESDVARTIRSSGSVQTPPSTGEYQTLHISGAVDSPHYTLKGRLSELSEPDDEIVLVDQKGGRTRKARQVLAESGFTKIWIPARISYQAALTSCKGLTMPGDSVSTEKQSVSATPITALACPSPAELELHSIHSTGYASHSSRVFNGTGIAHA